MEAVKIKICGLTCVRDALLLNEYGVEYAGFVLFYPKSRRNLDLSKAIPVMQELDSRIKKTAVVVSPDLEQIRQMEEAGFDLIQIHGSLDRKVAEQIFLPVFRAVQVEQTSVMETALSKYFCGFVLDGKNPGGGTVFDWNLTREFDRENKKLMLAGGLTAENVQEGIRQVKPDIVDVSTGVEFALGQGKDPEKVRRFVEMVRSMDMERKKE